MTSQAEEFYGRALAGAEIQLGREHPDTLMYLNNLGVCRRDLGRLEDAEELLQRAVAAREVQLGAMHPNTLRSVSGLAKLRVAQGRSNAEPLFRRVLEGEETQLGTSHAATLETMSDLAKLLEAKGALQEAAGMRGIFLCFQEFMRRIDVDRMRWLCWQDHL